MDYFRKKNILITGASTGIGKALVEKLAHLDCNLFLIARRIEKLNEIKSELLNYSSSIFCFSCDVMIKKEVIDTFRQISGISPHIDVAILNAGIGINMKAENYSSGPAEKIFGTNVLGVIYWIEQLLPAFLKSKSGVIAGVSSIADNRGYSRSGFYCASKAALTIYLEGIRGELKSHGIKVITIKPGFVKTPLTDKNDFRMPLIMQADKAANIILKGISKEKRIIQFPLISVIGSKIIGMIPERLFHWADGLYK